MNSARLRPVRPGHPGRPVRKVMLYSHDTYGLGHLRRNLRIANHLLSQADGLRIVLVSGSSVAGCFPIPPGLTVVKLPPVRKVGAELYQPVNPTLSIGLIRRTRTAIMADVVRRFQPDLLLVDHSPAGMNGELRGVFDAVRDHSPATRVVLGLRDVLDDPPTVTKTWTEQDIYGLLDEVYDEILVYGSREVFDVGRQYRLPPRLHQRLQYTGYLGPARAHNLECAVRPGQSNRPYVLATAGGGGDGVAVLAAAMEAGASLGLATKVVTGPLIDDSDFETLDELARRTPGVEMVRFHPELRAAMAGAAAVVTMGGYNSLCEAISARVPTVVVPRNHPRLEQTIRARLFSERGLVDVVPPGPGLGARIARAVAAGAGSRPSGDPIDLGGLNRLAALVLGDEASRCHLAPARTARHQPLSRPSHGLGVSDGQPA
jgi:predicted glycosyltransferase